MFDDCQPRSGVMFIDRRDSKRSPARVNHSTIRSGRNIYQQTLAINISCLWHDYYILPAFKAATRFSKAAVSTLSVFPLAIAASATAIASSFLPAPQRMLALAERLGKVSLSLMDWSMNFSASSQFLSRA